MGGVAYGVTFVRLYQETAVAGPLAALVHAFPVDADGLFTAGLHLKVEGLVTFFLGTDNSQRVGLHWGGK